VFIEAGANDGISQSNTLYFEKYLGWRGLLVEPIPELAARCYINRPACYIENSALVPFGFPSKTIEMRYCNLMSIVNGARGSAVNDQKHVQEGTTVQGGVRPYDVTVQARCLSNLIDEYEIGEVDLLSLDVEGFELPALKGLDLSRHRPRYVLVESSEPDAISAYLGTCYRQVSQLSFHDYLFERT
jgi:FkbM family methyltransferase